MWCTGKSIKMSELHFQVVYLNKRKWIEASTYPRFTMIGQSLGSVYLAWEALNKFTPQFYFDTSGYAFTYPLAWLFGCKVLCYTHYPTISSDMVERVKQRNSMYNNNSLISGRYGNNFRFNSFYWSIVIWKTVVHYCIWEFKILLCMIKRMSKNVLLKHACSLGPIYSMVSVLDICFFPLMI